MPQTRSVITFSKREGGMPMPHLLDIQTAAFDTLLVPDDVHGARQDVSLERVFRDLFPITDVNEKYKLEFLGYALGEAKYSVEECVERDMTYAAPLKAKLRLDVYEEVEGQKRLKNAIEKEVYLGELPIMTPLARRRLRGGYPPEWPAAVFGADHPVPWIVGRVHHRYPRRDLRPHRQEEKVPRYGAPAGLRAREQRGHPEALLRHQRAEHYR